MFGTSFNSTAVLSGDFTPDSDSSNWGTMRLEFAHGSPQAYHVPQHVWGALLEENTLKEQGSPVASVGRFFNRSIKFDVRTGYGFKGTLIESPEPASQGQGFGYEIVKVIGSTGAEITVNRGIQSSNFARMDAESLALRDLSAGEPVTTSYQVRWYDNGHRSIDWTVRLSELAKQIALPVPSVAAKTSMVLVGVGGVA